MDEKGREGCELSFRSYERLKAAKSAMKRGGFSRVFGLGLVLILIGTLSPAGLTAPPARPGGTLVVALDGDPPSLNPIVSVAVQTHFPANNIYDTLVSYDEKFNLVARLATSWRFSPDGKTLQFNLAQGVTWHDGRPFSAEDVKFTIEQLGSRYNPTYGAVFGTLESVETPNPNTVILRFKEPNAVVFSILGDPIMSILPKHVYESGDARTNPANVRPIGTGPFKFGEWVRGDHLTLVKNESYFRRGLPYLDQLVFRVIPSAASRIAALERGEVGVVFPPIAYVDARRLSNNPNVRISFRHLGGDFTAVWPNLRVPPLNSLRVRQALSLAADRVRMVEQIAFGLSKPARAPIASSSPYFNSSLPEITRDVERANRLLDEAGYKRGSDGIRFTLRLHHVITVADFAKTAQILKENYEDIGVRVNLIPGEVSTTLEAVFANWDFDLAVYSARIGPEPALNYPRWFTTKGLTRAFFTNATGYSNRRVDRLVEESVSTVERNKRTAIYREIQRIIMGDLATVPLWEFVFITGYRADLENAFLQADARYLNFTETWLRR